MNFRSENIKNLSKELQELGIELKPRDMELILRMQEKDFLNLTKGTDPAAEFERLLSKLRK
jgi:hypothetical protein